MKKKIVTLINGAYISL